MIAIRICEESEARLMIREGCFKEYINMWSAQFPQKKLISQIKELHSKYGLGLLDAHKIACAMGADEDVALEVGENVIIRKRNDVLTIFHKVRDIWLQVDDCIDVFDSEAILSNESHSLLTSLCKEEIILHANSVKELAKSIYQYLCRYNMVKGILFSFGKHEIWRISDSDQIRIYSKTLKDLAIINSEDEIANHIVCYRKEQKLKFGSF